MPDFLSRLVERTFGLAPVVQPVIGSMFAPATAPESNYTPDLARDNESTSNPESFRISTAQAQRHGNPPATKPEKPPNKLPDNIPVQYIDSGFLDTTEAKHGYRIGDRDDTSTFTSVRRPRQNDSDSPDNVRHVPPRHVSELDNQRITAISAEPAHDKESFYRADSDNSETSEPQNTEDGHDRMPPTSEPMSQKETFHGIEHVETEKEDFAEENTLMPVPKAGNDTEQPHSPGSTEQDERSHPAGLQERQNTRTVSAPELPYEDVPANKNSGSRQTGSKNRRPSGKSPNEQFIEIADSHVIESIPEPSPYSSLPSGNSPMPENDESVTESPLLIPRHPAMKSPIISGSQNPKRRNTPKTNAALEQMGNMLIERHTVEPEPTTSTIKVTIGRIEVRAVTPPPQPQTPPPRMHPILSLDDYMKQYNG